MKQLPLFTLLALVVTLPLVTAPLAAQQQVGGISGDVLDPNGGAMPGVTVEASSDSLPRARATISDQNGVFRLPALPPGDYTVTFSLSGMETVTQEVAVLLQQTTRINAVLQPEGISEQIQVTSTSLIDASSTELKSAISEQVIDAVPTGQEYRDIVKLIPGVQYTENSVRGPSAGGNGQDNVYQFDGVNVTLPLFGTLSAEPSTHDIEQVSIVKGGAKALDFNRSGGFTINTLSKSGKSQFHGLASYQVQTDGMTGSRDVSSASEFDRDQDWATASIAGPIVQDNLFFYASYYRPTITRDSRSNLYGSVPDAESVRDELFGKLTFTPTDSLLINASYRDGETDGQGEGVTAEDTAGTVSSGSDSELKVAILEASYVINANHLVDFKYTDYDNPTSGRPDNLLGFQIALDGSVGLDVGNLDRQGRFNVPQPRTGNDFFNAPLGPIIDRYGFLENGVRVGGGTVGVGNTINDQDFFRESYQLGWDWFIDGNVGHELHFGFQNYEDGEDLARTSNGWGLIDYSGGLRTLSDGTPVIWEARFQQQSLNDPNDAVASRIISEVESTNFEINDTITFDNWSVNIGALFSNDELFGQGLRHNSASPSGFELAPGNRYKMYEVEFEDQIQPRIGVVRSFDGGNTTAYASYALYTPAASSLPRAASWDRNLSREIRAFFDANGTLIGQEAIRSSSGKFFQPNLDPRSIDEYILGGTRRFSPRLTARSHFRYRKGSNFWEDTNNNARSRFEPPAGIPTEDYIPNLNDFRFAPDPFRIGGSSYVIAELDGAFTKYYEVSTEAEWRLDKAWIKGSYVWSHYYGNFDQDNTTTGNDGNIFIGSSFIADGAGRQLWDNRYGNLKGDRRNQVKLYGFYELPWNATAGAFAVYQSGEPWEAWDVEVYRHLTGSSSDTSRFAEPAGSRTTSSHHQLDLNYTQHFKLGGRYDLQLRADLFNAFDRQTGYNIQNKVNQANFGEPRSFYLPRRFQVAVRFEF